MKWILATALLLSMGAGARAQHTGPDAERSPRFVLATGAQPVPLDVRRMPVLGYRVALTLNGATMKDALTTLARESGLALSFSDDMLPKGARVDLEAKGITVAAALTDILFDAGLDVLFRPNGRAVLVRRLAAFALGATGTIGGHVTERGTNTPIVSAQVMVAGTGLARFTDDKGNYRIPGVPAGEREIAVRRLGFEVASRKVKVGDGETVMLDVAMARVATALTEVVTTATGERSRLEVGNAIGTIKADSLVPTTLIRSMSDLLAARTPGVIVSRSTGLVGAPSLVRIRGVASVSLSNDPIIVLDGIRLTPASYAGAGTSLGNSGVVGAGGAVSRLDDIDPNTIESIDVLRGPSASSLYGTDAAAGVIVIKTKKGVAGAYRFNLLADEGTSRVLGGFPLQYVGFGHLPNGTPVATCFLYRQGSANVLDHTCAPDSVRGYDSYNDPRLNPLGTGTAQNLSANLSGGTEQLREFLSLRLSSAVGLSKLPAAEQDRIARMWGEAPPSWVRRPNTEQNITGASRTNLQVAHGLDLSLTANGIYRNTLGGMPGGALKFGGLNAFGNGLARSLYDTLVYLPAEDQRTRTILMAKRGYTSASATYTPLSWLVLRGTVGGDYTLRTGDALTRAADCTAILNPAGCSSFHSNNRTETFVTTIDVGVQATWQPRSGLSFRTSTGEQLSRTKMYDLLVYNSSSKLAFGTDLLTPNPVSTTTGAQLFSVTENRDESATAGWYLEETASLKERLFLTAAFRQDVASAFGHNVNAKAPVYPKFGLSWLISDEPFFPRTSFVSSLRLRTAYGHSGQEARQTAVQDQYGVTSAMVDGTLTPSIGLGNPGNPNLRPERTAEWEGGFDVSLLENERVHVEATLYRKVSNDAITTSSLPLSLGGTAGFPSSNYLQSFNLGKVENRGWELSAAIKLLDGRTVAWDLTVNASRNSNRLVSSSTITACRASCRGNVVGYPLESFFGHVITGYTDFNHDGILQLGEVQFSTPFVFLGSVYPESELTYGNTVRLWGGAVQVQANFDQVNGQSTRGNAPTGAGGPQTSAQAFQAGSLAAQAAWLQGAFSDDAQYAGKANTLRFAELSVTATVPRRIAARLLRARTATVTLAGRNLALWTSSAAKDPDMNGNVVRLEAGSSSTNGIPQPRDVTVRLNLGY